MFCKTAFNAIQSMKYLLQKAADLRLSLPGSGEGGLVAVIAASAGYPGLFHRGYSAIALAGKRKTC